MKPPRNSVEYERVPVYDEWVNGEIVDIEYDLEHKRIWQGEEKVGPAVRLKFNLDGCKYPHRTKWLSFSYHEKSNLFTKYIVALVEGAKPNMDFDLDTLKAMKIKTMWSANGDFDNLEMIRPAGAKISAAAKPDKGPEDEAPF